jgi:hypothetical protein
MFFRANHHDQVCPVSQNLPHHVTCADPPLPPTGIPCFHSVQKLSLDSVAEEADNDRAHCSKHQTSSFESMNVVSTFSFDFKSVNLFLTQEASS